MPGRRLAACMALALWARCWPHRPPRPPRLSTALSLSLRRRCPASPPTCSPWPSPAMPAARTWLSSSIHSQLHHNPAACHLSFPHASDKREAHTVGELTRPLEQPLARHPRVVIIGGGFAGLHAAKGLARLPRRPRWG